LNKANKMLTNSILFISDSSIQNPIIHSQGIPLLLHAVTQGMECYLITFEIRNDNRNHNFTVNEIKKLNHIPIIIDPNKLVPGWVQILIKGLIKSFNLVLHKKINIIHSRSFNPAVIASLLKVIFRNRIKIIYDNRGLFLEEEILKGNWDRNDFKAKSYHLLESFVLKKCDFIVVVSNSFKNILLKKKSCVSEKITVIPNRTNIVKNINVTARSENRPLVRIVYSGSFAFWQNVDGLKKVFLEANNVFENIKFRVITYQKNKFEQYFSNVEDLKINIEIISVRPNQIKNNFLDCNFGILYRGKNIVNKVAAPLKFAEYLSVGLPVLVSDELGDISDMVESHNLGVVIKDGAIKNALIQMKKLINNSSTYERCYKFAVEYLNVEKSFQQYISIYNSLLSTK